MAFTSPPYYSTELYDGVALPWTSLDAYIHDFFLPTLTNTIRSLRIGGVVGINLAIASGSTSWERLWRKACEELHCQPLPTLQLPSVSNFKTNSQEVIFVARRRA